MLTKDLLRVSRAGGGYHPQFVRGDRSARETAARVLGVFQGHVGRSRAELEAALAGVESGAPDFKLVRGFAKLLKREATFETRAGVEPERAREVAFDAAERVGVVTGAERDEALSVAAERLGVDSTEVADSLYADLEKRRVLTSFDSRWGPDELVAQYDLSLAQTSLFDATEVSVSSSDPRSLVSAVKRLRLMYEIRKTNGDREVVITGPDALFRRSRRYGTRFARLLRSVVKADSWRLEATIDDRGTERTMVLTDGDLRGVPGTEPVTEVSYDSRVEEDFASRFDSLDLDWELTREPEPLAAGARVMIPDFAFDYKYGDFRVYFEIMGFWTPEYVEKKLGQLATLEDVEMVVAVDESLGVGEAIEARDHRVIPYSSAIRLKDVRRVLRHYEDELVADSASSLPDELRPDPDVIGLDELASVHGVSEAALDAVSFPDHERVGRTLIRPVVFDELEEVIEPRMSLADAQDHLREWRITESSVLSHLGYEVRWDGLSGGTIERID